MQLEFSIFHNVRNSTINIGTAWGFARPVTVRGAAPSLDTVTTLQQIATLTPVLQLAAHPVGGAGVELGADHAGPVQPLRAAPAADAHHGVVGAGGQGAPDLRAGGGVR